MSYWQDHRSEDNEMVHFSGKKCKWSFAFCNMYYESGFDIQLPSITLIIHKKNKTYKIGPYDFKSPWLIWVVHQASKISTNAFKEEFS